MQACVASVIKTVHLTINRILKKEKTICRIPRKEKITDFHKTVSGRFKVIRELGEKKKIYVQ